MGLIKKTKIRLYNLLRKSQKYTKTDMVYLAKGGFWLSLKEIVAYIISFLSVTALANLLPKETYGTYRYIISMSALFAVFTFKSMGTAVMRSVARGYEGSLIPALKTKIYGGLGGSLASLVIAGYYYLNTNFILATSFLIIAIILPFFYSFNLYVFFLQGKKLFNIFAKYDIITNISSVAILIAVLFLTKNLFLILLAYFIPLLLLRFIFYKFTFIKFRSNNKQDPKTVSYGIYLSLLGIISNVSEYIDKILLWHFFGPVQLAIYTLGITPVEKISGPIKRNIISLSFPKLSKQQNNKEFKKSLPKKTVKLFVIIIPIIIIYIFIAPYLFKLFFPQYLESIKYSQIFILSIIFIPFYILGNTMVAQMKKKEIAIIKFAEPAFRIISLLILAPLYGILGIIIARIISDGFSAGLYFFLFKKMKV